MSIRPGARSDLQGSVMRIYVNGELSASRPYDRSGVRESTGPLWLGGILRTGAGFHGLIDDVRIWRRALNADEIRHQMLGQTEKYAWLDGALHLRAGRSEWRAHRSVRSSTSRPPGR
ncbi:MAG: hypothetical protein CME13_20380 [Gemmatimonadetes bacterium]|nr:hypothetical protein [Gemmatimonadota bacterium]HCV25003.1 hypothetical protein [Candidatus Latescibacterota bacterium]